MASGRKYLIIPALLLCCLVLWNFPVKFFARVVAKRPVVLKSVQHVHLRTSNEAVNETSLGMVNLPSFQSQVPPKQEKETEKVTESPTTRTPNLVMAWRAAGRPNPLQLGNVYPRKYTDQPGRTPEPYCRTKTTGQVVLEKVNNIESLPIGLQRVLPPQHHNGTTGLNPIRVLWAVGNEWVPHAKIKQGTVSWDQHGGEVGCEIPCHVVIGPRSRLDSSIDAVVSTSEVGDGKLSILQAAYASEYPAREAHFISNPARMKNFEVSMSIPATSDVMLMAHNDKFCLWKEKPGGFYEPRDYSQLFCTPRKKDNSTFLATFIAHVCKSSTNREKWVLELSDYIGVSRPAKCLKNMPFPPGSEKRSFGFTQHQYDQKIEFISRFKFHLAFENAIYPNWVTEKVFNALTASTVPVYFGTADIEQWVPLNSVIKISDFESPLELAQYLAYLDTHDEEYAKYFKWKASEVFIPIKMQASKMYAPCGLCKAIHDKRSRESWGEVVKRKVYDQASAVWKPID